MIKKWNAGVWAGLAFAVFAVVFFLLSLQYPYTGYVGPGPGFFPFWVCLAIFIFAILYMIESFQSKEKKEKAEAFFPKGKELKQILTMLGALLLFVGSLMYLGYIVASTIFMFILFYKTFKLYTNLGISLGVALIMFLLFKVFLQIPLPLNIFGF